eukprot:6224061-Alexandrium_andersonii.AAC.1
MSASLVGSEMCIRDSPGGTSPRAVGGRSRDRPRFLEQQCPPGCQRIRTESKRRRAGRRVVH